MVNQAFVKKFFPKEDPMGRHFGIFDQKYSSSFEIVGIVADAKYNNPREPVRPMYFRPLTQELTGLTEANAIMAEGRSLYINSVTLHFQRPPQNLDAMVRRTLAEYQSEPDSALISIRWTTRWLEFNQERLVARLTTLFGLLALVLASVGLYGITSYRWLDERARSGCAWRWERTAGMWSEW